jgi:hypothetical protein
MISVTSITGDYILQPSLLEKHRKTLAWLSATLLWKREFNFFQNLLDRYASKFITIEDKKKIDHFQNLILYYNGEVIDELGKKLREHESKLANMLQTKNELKTEYFKEHDAIMQELESFLIRFNELKEELFGFIEKVM